MSCSAGGRTIKGCAVICNKSDTVGITWEVNSENQKVSKLLDQCKRHLHLESKESTLSYE